MKKAILILMVSMLLMFSTLIYANTQISTVTLDTVNISDILDNPKVVMLAQADVTPPAAEVPAEPTVVVPPIPGMDGDLNVGLITEALMKLVQGGLGTLGILIAALLILIEVMKSKISKGWFGSKGRWIRRGVVIIGGQILGIATMVSTTEMGWLSAVIAGLITSGGAVAIYELVIKPWRADKKA